MQKIFEFYGSYRRALEDTKEIHGGGKLGGKRIFRKPPSDEAFDSLFAMGTGRSAGNRFVYERDEKYVCENAVTIFIISTFKKRLFRKFSRRRFMHMENQELLEEAMITFTHPGKVIFHLKICQSFLSAPSADPRVFLENQFEQKESENFL